MAISKFVGGAKQGLSFLGEEDRDGRSAHGDEEIPMGLGHVSNDAVGLVRICRDNHFISEEVLYHSKIVNALMGFSILTHIQAIMGANEFEVRLIDIVEAMLIICLIHAKDAEVGKEREKTESGDRSCDGSGIVFLDSSLEEMIRKLFGEPCRFHRGSQVTIEDREGKRGALSDIGLGDIDEGISEGTSIV
jgi:hypothetical protein